jgi:hypothetical protein
MADIAPRNTIIIPTSDEPEQREWIPRPSFELEAPPWPGAGVCPSTNLVPALCATESLL